MAYPLSTPYPSPTEGGGSPALPTHPFALPGTPGNGNTGIVPPSMSTGLPAQQQVTLPNAHPVGVPTTAGNNSAAVPLVPGQAAAPANQATNFLSNLGLTGANTNPADLANQYMTSLLGQDSPYIRDARQRGMEVANARGLSNSSIASGASERSAIEAAQPLFNAAMGLNQQRENQGWQTGERLGTQNFNQAMQQASWNWQTGERVGTQQFQAGQNQADRELKTKLQSDAAFQQNWLSSQDFSRQFNGALAMLPINTASQFMQTIQQYAIENPEIYTPEMISGMQNFFTQSMSSLLSQYFPNTGGA